MQTPPSSHNLHTRYVEKIAARFHRETTAFLNQIGTTPEGVWLLNRLLLLFFLQEQGFLCGNQQYLQTLLSSSEEGSFYQQVLLPLFRQLGESQRIREYDQLLGPVPTIPVFFDGVRVSSELSCLHIPDSAFDALFRCFGSYRWTLDEKEEPDVITPTIIAHLLEKRLNGKDGAYYSPEDVTEYIGRNTILPALVEKVCKAAPEFFDPQSPFSIWWRLQNNPDRYIHEAKKKGVALPLPSDIARGVMEVAYRSTWNRSASEAYALPGETWRDVVERRKVYEEIHERITRGHLSEISHFTTYNLDLRRFLQDVIESCTEPKLLLAFYAGLTGNDEDPGLSILDPTCGAGAFLLTGLTVLEPIYTVCLERMVNFVVRRPYNLNFFQMREMMTVLDLERHHPSRAYFVRKQIVLNNLYGVDLSEEAIDVTKLCLLLRLIAALSNAEDLQWLPDLDFTIHHGNALVGIGTEKELRTLLRTHEENAIVSHQSSLFANDPPPEQQANPTEAMRQILKQMSEVQQLRDEFYRLQMRHGA